MKDPIKDMRLAQYPVGDVTQFYGENPDLYDKEFGMRGHNGADLVRPHGDHLYAVESGTIVNVRDDPTGYGRTIRIVNIKTGHEWTYGHMSYIGVTQGHRVLAGAFVGKIGNTGFVVSNSTGNGFWGVNPYAGTHLHLGLRLIEKDPNGWSYAGLETKVRVLNYTNGNKGAVDPVPYFNPLHLRSSKIITLGSVKQSKTLVDFGYLLKGINL